MPATEKQQIRQIRRRNSIGNLADLKLASKKQPAARKSASDKVMEALISPDVLEKMIPVISDKIGESIALSINKAIESQLQACIDQHIKPLVQTVSDQQKIIEEQKQMI